MFNWLRKRFGWTEGIKHSEIIVNRENAIDQAQQLLEEGGSDHTALRHIAGITRNHSAQGSYLRYLNKLSRLTENRLAAARLLAMRGDWDYRTLRLYGRTGYQQFLVHNPMYRFTVVTTGTDINYPELREWLNTASDDELRLVTCWYDEAMADENPRLHARWLDTLCSLSGSRMSEIICLVGSEAPTDMAGDLLAAVSQYVKGKLTIDQTGQVKAGTLLNYIIGGKQYTVANTEEVPASGEQ